MALDLDCLTTEYFTGDGVKTAYNLSFDFIETSDINVAWYSDLTSEYQTLPDNDPVYGYSIDEGSGNSFIRFINPPAANQKFFVYRLTPVDPLKVDFEPGHPIKAQDLDDNFKQLANAIEDTRCIVEGIVDKELLDPEDIYWKKAGETVYSNIEWASSDCYIASTKAIDQRFSKLVYMGINPPPTPNYDGQLWWDTDDGNLYVFYVDGSSQQWVQASPGIGDSPSNGVTYGRKDGTWVAITDNDGNPTLTDVPNDPADSLYLRKSGSTNTWKKLDEVLSEAGGPFVKTSGSNMTGDLTLGTDKITLDASGGNITSTITSGANLTLNKPVGGFITINATDSAASTGLGNSASDILQIYGTGDITSNKQVFNICGDNNARGDFGDVLIGGTPTDPNITLHSEGAATFNGTLRINDEDGDPQAYIQNDGSFNAAWGQIGSGLATYISGLDGKHYIGWNGTLGEEKILFNPADGSATFAGNVEVAGLNSNTSPIWVDRGTDDDSAAFYVQNSTGVISRLNCDGSAEFKGALDVTNSGRQLDESTLVLNNTNTDGYSIYSKSNGTGTFSVSTGGSVYIGDNASPAISLLNNGSATFTSTITSGDDTNSSPNTSYALLAYNNGDTLSPTIYAKNFNDSGIVFRGSGSSTVTSEIFANGNANFESRIAIGSNTLALAPTANALLIYDNAGGGAKVTILAGGAATFVGNVTAPNVTFNLEPDNDANYTTTTETYTEEEELTPYVPAVEEVVGPLGNVLVAAVPAVEATYHTVTKTRDVRTYTGPTLDVKDRLQNLISRVHSLEANEITDDATDNALLQLVASLTTRLDDRDEQIAALTTRIQQLENGGN